MVVAACLALLVPATASASGVLRGICEPDLIESWRLRGPAVVREFAERLGADVVRINLPWSEAESAPGVYDEDYLGRAVSAVREIRARDMQVVIVVWDTPRWASDWTLWAHPVPGDKAGVYRSYYPPALDSLDRLRAFMEELAGRLEGEVRAYSCWVEPNLWTYLYPQRTASDAAFAARRYTKMLAAFSGGVRAGDPQALVVAGETSPSGDDTRLRTSPQRFARQMARLGAAEHFDVFAHHPYPTGGNDRIAPWSMPRDPSRTVWLANLDAVLGVFPGKPVYLSEFAYATAPSLLFGVSVSAARQASYLTAAFRMAARYQRVEMLVWFPREDWAADGTYGDRWGHYCGLISLSGRPKRAYFAFARGNRLTLDPPGRVVRGGSLTLRGVLTNATMGALGGKALVVLARRPGHSWVRVAATTTRSDGSYKVRLRSFASATWKVSWSGVVSSPRRWVPVD